MSPDDLKLLCPIIRELQKMVNICSEFCIEYDILYNEKKTVCTCYSRADKYMESFQIYLNGKVLKCETIVKHLGIYITHINSDQEKKGRIHWHIQQFHC